MTLLDILTSRRNTVVPRLDPALWPHTTRVDHSGRLMIGGVTLTAIANESGSPAHILDEADFRRRARRYRKGLPGAKVVYAGKALLTTAVAKWAAEEKLGIDVCSGDELTTALAGGLDAARIVYHADTKSHDDLRAAVQAGVGRIVVDSMADITYLAGLARTPQPVLLRVTPGIDIRDSGGHRGESTGVDDQEFGISPAGGQVTRAAARILAEPMLRLVGLHCHLGSQITDAGLYGEAVGRMIVAMADVRRAHQLVLGELSIGGGHGAPHVGGDPGLDVDDFALCVDDALDAACAAERFPRPTIVVEPGRALVARAGVTLCRVQSVKTRAGGRTFVAVDGGMGDNPRPAPYGATCSATLANRHPLGPPRAMTVVARHCESGDEIIRDADLPADIHPGDLIAVACTGAHQHSMAVSGEKSTHNPVGRPPLVSVHDGRIRTLVRRQTAADPRSRDRG